MRKRAGKRPLERGRRRGGIEVVKVVELFKRTMAFVAAVSQFGIVAAHTMGDVELPLNQKCFDERVWEGGCIYTSTIIPAPLPPTATGDASAHTVAYYLDGRYPPTYCPAPKPRGWNSLPLRG